MGMWSRRFMSRWEKWTLEPAEREKTVSVREKDIRYNAVATLTHDIIYRERPTYQVLQ